MDYERQVIQGIIDDCNHLLFQDGLTPARRQEVEARLREARRRADQYDGLTYTR